MNSEENNIIQIEGEITPQSNDLNITTITNLKSDLNGVDEYRKSIYPTKFQGLIDAESIDTI